MRLNHRVRGRISLQDIRVVESQRKPLGDSYGAAREESDDVPDETHRVSDREITAIEVNVLRRPNDKKRLLDCIKL